MQTDEEMVGVHGLLRGFRLYFADRKCAELATPVVLCTNPLLQSVLWLRIRHLLSSSRSFVSQLSKYRFFFAFNRYQRSLHTSFLGRRLQAT
jgi:hypothetical protein